MAEDQAMQQAATPRQARLLREIGDIALAEGFAHLRIEDMAGRLKCSRATLYAIAPTKEALFAKAFNLIADSWIAYANERTRATPLGPERIARYAESVAQCQMAASPQLWRDMQVFPMTRAVLLERSAESSRDYRQYLAEAMSEGSIRSLNAVYISELILAGARLTRTPDVLEASGLSAEQAMVELARFIRGGVDPAVG
jgi:AcrR family transcriptional regulator